MKKSIFLFFAAILCAMSAYAEMIYLKPSSNWKDADAIFYVWYWTGNGGGTAGKMQPVELGLYGFDIGNNDSFLITRNKPTSNGPWTDTWAQTGDLKYDSSKNCYLVINWNENGSGLIAKPSAHIAGDEGLLGVNWAPGEAANKMTKQDDGTYTLVKTVTLDAKTYFFKVTDGTWDWSLGDPNASNNDKNAELTISEAGEYNVTFTYNPTANIVSAVAEKVEAEEPETPVYPEPAETETVYFVNAEDWTGTIYAYAWKDGDPKVENASWPGAAATKEANKIGGHDVYSYTAEKGKYAKVIFNNNGGKQTADMTWTAGQYICKNVWCADEDAVLAKLNGPVEYVSVYFINTVKWSAVNIYTWSPEVKSWPGVAMTKEAEQIGGFDVYSYTVEKGTTFGGMKFNENGGNQTGDLQWTDGKYYIYNYGEVVGWFTKEAAEAKLAAPVVTYDYYIAGTEAMTGHNWNPVGLGIEDNDGDGIYSHTFTLDAGGDYQFKVTQDSDWNPNWGYSKLDKTYDGVTNSGDDGENIKINLTETKTITVHFDSKAGSISLEGLDSQDKVTYDYYIAGTLPGAAWNPASLGMTKEDDVYKATFDLAASTEYEFKITDGQWNSEGDNTHEHTTLATTYVGVTGGNGSNIKINLETAKSVTVTFNSTEDKIYLNLDEETAALTYKVKVPAGTEKCFIAGPCGSWDFKEMNPSGETDIFTIAIVGAKENDEYKYACQADWAYAEVIEGGGNRTKWTALDEVTEWNQPAEVKCYLMGIGGDWTTGIEMEEDGDQFKLLCQPIAEDEQFKFKHGDTWSDGVENYDFPGINWVDDNNDGNSNITLPAGNYNFYYKKATNQVWIEAATDCGLPTITLTTGNNDDVITANIGKNVNVVIERSFTANAGYYTLCVPFNMPDSVIGKAYRLGDITKHVTGEGININLKEEKELTAGMPYLVLPKADMNKLVVKDVTIQPDGASGQGVVGSQGLNVQIFFQGYYSAPAAPENQTNGTTQYYVGNNGYLYNEVVDIRGLCGLFTITDKNGDPLKVRARVVTREEVETGLDNNQLPNTNIQKVLENGQLIIIRDGVKYNIQGQVIK